MTPCHEEEEEGASAVAENEAVSVAVAEVENVAVNVAVGVAWAVEPHQQKHLKPAAKVEEKLHNEEISTISSFLPEPTWTTYLTSRRATLCQEEEEEEASAVVENEAEENAAEENEEAEVASVAVVVAWVEVLHQPKPLKLAVKAAVKAEEKRRSEEIFMTSTFSREPTWTTCSTSRPEILRREEVEEEASGEEENEVEENEAGEEVNEVAGAAWAAAEVEAPRQPKLLKLEAKVAEKHHSEDLLTSKTPLRSLPEIRKQEVVEVEASAEEENAVVENEEAAEASVVVAAVWAEAEVPHRPRLPKLEVKAEEKPLNAAIWTTWTSSPATLKPIQKQRSTSAKPSQRQKQRQKLRLTLRLQPARARAVASSTWSHDTSHLPAQAASRHATQNLRLRWRSYLSSMLRRLLRPYIGLTFALKSLALGIGIGKSVFY